MRSASARHACSRAGEAEARRDLGETVAGGPAHDAGKGVHGSASAQLPQARVRLIEDLGCTAAQRLEPFEQRDVAAVGEALVEEDMGCRENGRTVDVVLHLPPGIVADAHRPHAAIPRQARHLRLGECRVAVDAVDGLQRSIAAAGHDVEDVTEVALHGVGGIEPVERIDDEIAVAQPAIAIVPVASRRRRLGYRCRHRGDDRAGVVEGVLLQRDGGADDGVLPFERNGQSPHPVAPVAHAFPRPGGGRSRPRRRPVSRRDRAGT